MTEMNVNKWWNEICGRGKRDKVPREKLASQFHTPRNPHGLTETRNRDPNGGRLETNRLRHGGTISLIIFNLRVDVYKKKNNTVDKCS